MRLRLLILAIAGALLALPAAAHAGSVQVVAPDGSSQTLDLADNQSEQDVRNVSYSVGEDSRTVSGFSLTKLLSLAGVGQTEWTSATIEGLSVDEKDRFDDGQPVFYEDRDGDAVFIRPQDDDGPAQTRAGSTIAVRAFDSDVQLTISPDRPEIETGDKVTFEVETSGGDGSPLQYRWFAEGVGTKVAGDRMSFRFSKADDQGVNVIVTALQDGEPVGSDGTLVIVGDPKKSDKDRKGGGDNKDEDAPDSGSFGGPDGSGTGTGPGGNNGAGEGPESGDDRAEPNAPDTPSVDVLGEVLGQSEVAQQAAAEAGSAREGTPVEKSSIPGIALGLGAVLALYGLGAGRELKPKRKGVG